MVRHEIFIPVLLAFFLTVREILFFCPCSLATLNNNNRDLRQVCQLFRLFLAKKIDLPSISSPFPTGANDVANTVCTSLLITLRVV